MSNLPAAHYEGRKFDATVEVPRLHGWYARVRDRLLELIRDHGVKVPKLRPVDLE